MIGLLASLLRAVEVPRQQLDRVVSSGWLEVTELALGVEAGLFGARGRFSVRGGRLCDPVCRTWRNRYANNTFPVSCVLSWRK